MCEVNKKLKKLWTFVQIWEQAWNVGNTSNKNVILSKIRITELQQKPVFRKKQRNYLGNIHIYVQNV